MDFGSDPIQILLLCIIMYMILQENHNCVVCVFVWIGRFSMFPRFGIIVVSF